MPIKSEICYLGVVLDKHMRLIRHVERAVAKAVSKGAQIKLLMSNITGPRASKCKLDGNIVRSIVLYAAPSQATAVEYGKARAALEKAERMSLLSATFAYRTVSTAALRVRRYVSGGT